MKLEVQGLTVRPATEQDLDFRRRLFLDARGDVLSLLPRELADMQFRAQTQSYRQNYPSATTLILEREGQPIGALIADEGPTIHLVDIAILESYRNCGLGSAVLRELQSHASQRHKPVTLSVALANPAARLYSRLGFKEIGADAVYRQLQWP